MLATTVFEIIGYIENPVLEKDANRKKGYRVKKILTLLFLVTAINIFIFSVIIFLQSKLENQSGLSIRNFITNISNLPFILSEMFFVPLMAELVFRGFLHKVKRNFKFFFYLSAILFALFQVFISYSESQNIYLTLLLLFFGYFFLGMVLGFIHIRFSFVWAYILNVSTYIISELVLLKLLLP